MIVLGIDPSLTATGYAYDTHLAVTPHTTTIGDQRLAEIYRAMLDILAIKQPSLAVLEDLPTHGQGAGKTGMAQGAIRVALLTTGTPYVTIPPASLKKFATGKGNATKPDMRMALFKRLDVDVRDDNCVDARWLMEMGLHALGAPTFPLPATQTEIVWRFAWPHPKDPVW